RARRAPCRTHRRGRSRRAGPTVRADPTTGRGCIAGRHLPSRPGAAPTQGHRATEHVSNLLIDGLETEFPAIRSLEARPTNLPPQRTSFLGREREVDEVSALLTETRILTLTGPGGTGKTRLALKVAADHLDEFSDGVFFVDLSSITESALVPSLIAQALVV